MKDGLELHCFVWVKMLGGHKSLPIDGKLDIAVDISSLYLDMESNALVYKLDYLCDTVL